MKKILLSSIFVFIICTTHFSQSNLTAKIWRQWAPDEGLWKDMVTETWKYNADNHNTEYFRHAHYVLSDFFFELEKQKRDSIFDNEGKLVLVRQRSWDDNMQYSSEFRYFYNANQELITEEYWYWDSSAETVILSSKEVFEYEADGENTIETKTSHYWNGNENIWTKNDENIRTLNNNGCEIENIHNLYYATGAFRYASKIINTYDENCRLLTYEQQRREEGEADFTPIRKSIYTFSDEENRFLTLNYDGEEWVEIEELFMEFDEEKNETKRYYLDYTSGTDPVFIYLYEFEYDEFGNPIIETFYYKDFESLTPQLKLNYRHLYSYIYNDKNQIETEAKTYESNFGTSKTIKNFEYYCNGQLKIETTENLPNINKIFYQYQSGSDCPEEKTQTNLQIGPNPTTGKLRITSDILESSSAQVRIFSSIGIEVFSLKVPELTGFLDLNLQNLTNGNYLLLVENGSVHKTEKVFIMK